MIWGGLYTHFGDVVGGQVGVIVVAGLVWCEVKRSIVVEVEDGMGMGLCHDRLVVVGVGGHSNVVVVVVAVC